MYLLRVICNVYIPIISSRPQLILKKRDPVDSKEKLNESFPLNSCRIRKSWKYPGGRDHNPTWLSKNIV